MEAAEEYNKSEAQALMNEANDIIKKYGFRGECCVNLFCSSDIELYEITVFLKGGVKSEFSTWEIRESTKEKAFNKIEQRLKILSETIIQIFDRLNPHLKHKSNEFKLS